MRCSCRISMRSHRHSTRGLRTCGSSGFSLDGMKQRINTRAKRLWMDVLNIARELVNSYVSVEVTT
jgi:hypothetical protein